MSARSALAKMVTHQRLILANIEGCISLAKHGARKPTKRAVLYKRELACARRERADLIKVLAFLEKGLDKI